MDTSFLAAMQLNNPRLRRAASRPSQGRYGGGEGYDGKAWYENARFLASHDVLDKMDNNKVIAIMRKHFPDTKYDEIFSNHEITGEDLKTMTREDFRSLGITKFSHLRRLENLIQNTDGEEDGDTGIHVCKWRFRHEKDGNFYLYFQQQKDAKGDEAKVLKEGKSGPIQKYDNFRDTLHDDNYIYQVEDKQHDSISQSQEEFEELVDLMKTAGIEVIGRAPTYVALDVEIDDINSQEENFSILCRTHIFWRDPQLIDGNRARYSSQHHNDLGELPITFNCNEESLPVDPDNLFKNAIDSSVVINERHEYFNPATGIAHVYYKHSLTLEEQMELHRFPFDRQLLHMFLNINIGDYKCLESAPAEWNLPQSLCNPIKLSLRPKVSSEFSLRYPSINLSGKTGKLIYKARVQRYSYYYFQNVIFPIFLINTLACSAFLLDHSELEGRVNLVIALLLTSVAFKFAVSAQLPLISYNTFIDVYILITYLVLAFVALESVIVFGRSSTVADRVDRDRSARPVVC
ncbi:hypothetical protein AAMO2058_001385900 [Amorphochlora amoebiformis]